MMKRRRLPFRRRFRRRPETYTIRECRECVNVWQTSTCSNPTIDVMEVFGMHMTKGLGDLTEVSSGGDKFVVVDGISFQSEHLHDPNKTFGGSDPGDDPQPFDVAFILTIWEALIVLPYAQGSQVPAYVPNLTSASSGQVADLADRVLWKRLSFLPIWGININGGAFPFPQLSATFRDTAAGPVRVKSKVRLDDRHGLYYVRNFVHDIFLEDAPAQNACLAPPQVTGSVPIENDALWKIFYHTRK